MTMGWGRYFFLGDLGQQLDLADQRDEIASLREELRRNRAASSGADVAQLQAENDELRLYLAAIVRLLTSKGIVSRDELRRVVDAIDAQDGRRDGRYKGRVE
jgi:multidrug resistance efflux pump